MVGSAINEVCCTKIQFEIQSQHEPADPPIRRGCTKIQFEIQSQQEINCIRFGKNYKNERKKSIPSPIYFIENG